MTSARSIRIEEREDRTIIFFLARELTHHTTRQLVPEEETPDIDLQGRDVGIELRALRFVRPFGLIYLYSLLSGYKSKSDSWLRILPSLEV